MVRSLVVNCSPGYNLGSQKIYNYLKERGDSVRFYTGDPNNFAFGYDNVYLSVVFSWDMSIAANIANRIKKNSNVECGGPGMFALSNKWKEFTGLECKKGVDDRFEKQNGDYKMTFSSRGCPVGCWFCIVPKMEGLDFTLYWDFLPAPFLCDNNLSALPIDFQEHVIDVYKKSDKILKDANSGFEPRSFDEYTYQRWKPIMTGPWRFALDTTSEMNEVERMMTILKKERNASKKRVYVLIGNESIEMCYERIVKVIEWGGEPHCQPVIKLNALEKKPIVKSEYGWTEQMLMDMARWSNRWLWRNIPLADYKPRIKEEPLFKDFDYMKNVIKRKWF